MRWTELGRTRHLLGHKGTDPFWGSWSGCLREFTLRWETADEWVLGSTRRKGQKLNKAATLVSAISNLLRCRWRLESYQLGIPRWNVYLTGLTRRHTYLTEFTLWDIYLIGFMKWDTYMRGITRRDMNRSAFTGWDTYLAGFVRSDTYMRGVMRKYTRTHARTRVYPKDSGLAARSENCKWWSSLPPGAVVSLFCESV
jgi:hypothetical protein